MAQPQPAPIDPATLPQLARHTMAAAKFPVLATLDGDQPRVRPVSPVRTDGFIVYVANLTRYGKTAEIAANPKVELCAFDGETWGNAILFVDRAGHGRFLRTTV